MPFVDVLPHIPRRNFPVEKAVGRQAQLAQIRGEDSKFHPAKPSTRYRRFQSLCNDARVQTVVL
jgi:hypothetical protein